MLERIEFRFPLAERDELRVMSGVAFLCSYSNLHAHYPYEMLRRRIEPALRLGQFHYHVDPAGMPAGFCNWAWLTPPVLQDVLATSRDLEAAEFNCGDQPFFYEFIAPFGHCRAVVRELRRQSFFQGRCIPSIRGKVYSCKPPSPRVQYFQF